MSGLQARIEKLEREAEEREAKMRQQENMLDAVRIGLHAWQVKEMKKTGRVIVLSPERRDQRVFKIASGGENISGRSVVVLNGQVCQEGVDYDITYSPSICTSYEYATLNWLSPKRKLRKTDQIAVSFVVENDDVGFSKENTHTLTVTDGETDVKFEVEAIEDVVSLVPCTEEDYEELLEQEEVKEDTVEEQVVIEPGVEVWHRLTGQGPWIVIQPCVLKVSSKQIAGGIDHRVNETFVEAAWTVQTDEDLKDYPEVVLTTEEPVVLPAPKREPWISESTKKTIAWVAGGSVLFGIVNAQWIVDLASRYFLGQ
jgi:hypothetical protein